MGIYRLPVTITGPSAGGPWVNVWHVSTDGSSSDQSVVNACATSIRQFYSDCATNIVNVGPILAPGLTITADFASEVSTQNQLGVTWSPLATGNVGANAATRLCMCVTWRSATAARRASGRTFVGPLNTLTTDADALPKPGAVTQLQTAAAGLVTRNASISSGGVVIYGLVAPKGGPKAPHQGYALARATTRRKYATLRTRG